MRRMEFVLEIEAFDYENEHRFAEQERGVQTYSKPDA